MRELTREEVTAILECMRADELIGVDNCNSDMAHCNPRGARYQMLEDDLLTTQRRLAALDAVLAERNAQPTNDEIGEALQKLRTHCFSHGKKDLLAAVDALIAERLEKETTL